MDRESISNISSAVEIEKQNSVRSNRLCWVLPNVTTEGKSRRQTSTVLTFQYLPRTIGALLFLQRKLSHCNPLCEPSGDAITLRGGKCLQNNVIFF